MLYVSDAFTAKLNNNDRKIVKRVYLYNTKFAVPSNGISFNVYSWDDDNDPDWTSFSNLTLEFPEDSDEYGSIPNLSLFWDNGVPFNLPLTSFAVKFTGYFYVDSDELDINNKLNFFFAGNGISFDFDWDSSAVTKTATVLNTPHSQNYEIVTVDSPGVGWYPITIHIWGKSGVDNAGFTALYGYSVNDITSVSSNLLYNGDASHGTTGWMGEISTDATNYYGTSPGFKFENIGGTFFDDNYGITIYNISKDLQYGKEYTLKFYAKLVDSSDSGSLKISLSISSISYSETITENWIEYTYNFTADQTNISSSNINFLYDYANGLYVDDIRLYLNNTFFEYDFTVLNAGVVNSTNSFLSPINVPYVMEINGEKQKNGYSQYSFTVPLGENGFVLDSNNNLQSFDDSTIVLSEGKLIKIYVGYLLDSIPTASQTIGIIDGYKEYIPRATLFIDKFEIDRNNNIITVNCIDILNITEQQFCVNYPDAASYWSAGYIRQDIYEKHSNDFISAYDKWYVDKAIKDLIIKSGIPASLLKGKEKRQDINSNIVDANDLILNKKNILEFNDDYGSDEYDKYNYYFDIGTRIHEALMKIVDVYGYILDTRYDGYVRLLESNNATFKIDGTADNSNYLGTTTTNYKAQNGSYLKLSGDGAYAKYSFKGNGISILFVRNTNAGPTGNNDYYWEGSPSVSIEIDDTDGNSIYTKDINLYYSGGERFYYDGIDYNIGDNPCFVSLTQALDYDQYIMEIKISGSYEIGIDQVWVYNYKYTNISKTFNTYKDDDGNIGTVGSLNFERGLDTFRNDILVVGKRNVFNIAANDVENTQKIIYDNIHSRDVDVNSVYNSFASNYMGRNIMTYIQEPSISGYAQAKWLSYNILVSYRNREMHPNFKVYGDPAIELHDCIAVNDKIIDSLGSDKFWINGYSESIKQSSWNVSYSLIGVQPFPSYESNKDYDISVFDSNYIVDWTITDINGRSRGNGYESDLTAAIPSGEGYINVDDVTQYPSPTGYVIVYSPSDDPFYGLYEYMSIDTVNNTLNGSFVWKNVDDFSTVDHTLYKVKSGYNLYESEDAENYIKINFVCLLAGEIKIGIKKKGHSGYVAGLSGSGGLTSSDLSMAEPLSQKVYPGDDITVYWGGVDQTGISYDHDTEADDIAGAKDFLADDGDYYVEIIYTSYNKNNTKTYSSAGYLLGSSGTKTDGKYIYAIRSYPDHVNFDIDFVRDIATEYIQGNDGGIITVDIENQDMWAIHNSNELNSYVAHHKNYVYTSNDRKSIDYNYGEIIINVQQLNIKGLARNYWIKFQPDVYRFLGVKNSTKDEIQKFIIKKFEGTEDYFNDGSPIKLQDSDYKEITINPKSKKWGGAIDVDEDFIQFMNDKDLNTDTYYIAYMLLIGIEIIDASGRRCTFTTDGKEEIWETSDDTLFDKYKWNVIMKRKSTDPGNSKFESKTMDYPYIEFIWIPEAIDDTSTYGTSGFLLSIQDNGITMHNSYAFGGVPEDDLTFAMGPGYGDNEHDKFDDDNHFIMCEPKCDTGRLPFKVCKTK